MLAFTRSVGLVGINAFQVDVEVDITRGLPTFTIVGLPDNAVKESRERVQAAIGNTGFSLPSKKLTILKIFFIFLVDVFVRVILIFYQKCI